VKKISLLLFLFINSLFAEIVWLDEAHVRLNWQEAMQYCKKHNAKLPSKKVFTELWIKNNRASDIEGFNLSVSYWTSDEVKDNKLAAYPFYFMIGRDTWYYKNDRYGVRCIQEK